MNETIPQYSPQQCDTILATLRLLETSPQFSKSKRYPALLRYIVENTLARNPGDLKERIIGTHLFGRALDYETSSDPIVRVVAGELRRRIALYFSLHPESAAFFDLPTGSYLMQFHFPGSDESRATPEALSDEQAEINEILASFEEDPCPESSPATLNHAATRNDAEVDEAAEVQHPVLQPASPAPVPAHTHWRWKISLAALLLVFVAATACLLTRSTKDANNFWLPILNSQKPALIAIGRPDPLSQTGIPSSSENHVILDNALVAAQICRIFGTVQHMCKISQVQSTDASELQDHSVIFVGGLDNPWSLWVMSQLRYQFQFDGIPDLSKPTRKLIVDRQNPSTPAPWSVESGNGMAVQRRTADYAIVARFTSDITHGLVVIIAGATPLSTTSASEYINSDEFMKQIRHAAPKEWSGQNFESVLRIDVVEGLPGDTRIERTQYW